VNVKYTGHLIAYHKDNNSLLNNYLLEHHDSLEPTTLLAASPHSISNQAEKPGFDVPQSSKVKFS
jgi:hypothetical protein